MAAGDADDAAAESPLGNMAEDRLEELADAENDGPAASSVDCHDLQAGKQRPESSAHMFRLTREAISLVLASGRKEFILSLVLRTLTGVGAALTLLVGRDILVGVLGSGHNSAAVPVVSLIPKLVLLAAIIVFMALSAALARELREVLARQTTRYAQERIIETASAVDLESYEQPAFHDALARAALGGQTRPMQLVEGLLGMSGSTLGIVGITVALFAVQPILVPLALGAAVPLLIGGSRAGRVLFGFEKRMTHADRERLYVYELLTRRENAKEVRVFGLAPFLRQRYEQMYEIRMAELRKVSRRRLIYSLQGIIGMSVVVGATLVLLLYLVSSGSISLANAGAAAGAVILISERMVFTIMSGTTLYESAMFVQDYTGFLRLKPARPALVPEAPAAKDFQRLVVDEVSFTYPSSHRPALNKVSIEVAAGEIVALVGENGSGKTTLAKLMCMLYRPESGQLFWNGADTASLNPATVQASTAVIFQDFLQYNLRVRDNIALGRQEYADDLDAIRQAAIRAGIDKAIMRLPDGYETMLGPEFAGGTELSTGQWQRIALARAFFRDAPLIILDEPTASLDARAESELFESIRTLFRGRAVLLISHRFSSVRSADRTYVLRDGEIIEQGTHEQLMAAHGLYEELFTLQASAYLDTPPRDR